MSPTDYAAGLAPVRLESRLSRGARQVMDPNQASQAASRCLFCYDAPCTQACPAGIDVARFIWDISAGNLRGAARTILTANIFGTTCARVCPTPDLCEGACVLQHAGQPPVNIPGLQLYALTKAREVGYDPFERKGATGKKVALVGAGPASLACAHDLALEGHGCTIFEARDMPGGLGTYALAPYKLTTQQALADVEWVCRVDGIQLRCGVKVGEDPSFETLLADYDAVFLGVGLGEDTRLQVKGHDLPGVVGALDLIERFKHTAAQDLEELDDVTDAMVIGGGSTALDVAQELRRLGIEKVTVLYRRDRASMPGHDHEVDEARRHGVSIRFQSTPVGYGAGESGRVERVSVARCKLGAPGPDGRPSVSVDDDDIVELDAQLVAVAIGQKRPGEVLGDIPDVAYTMSGTVKVLDDAGATGNPKVFAAGDCVSGGEELVHAVAAGKRSAAAMHRLLAGGEG
jgi:glutamate synthase (NADPH/NADH) small chain